VEDLSVAHSQLDPGKVYFRLVAAQDCNDLGFVLGIAQPSYQASHLPAVLAPAVDPLYQVVTPDVQFGWWTVVFEKAIGQAQC
jgi:hypothetical protein